MKKVVCIFGSYKNFNNKTKKDAIELGRLLARDNFVVASGGFGGVMEDVSRGAKLAGGDTLGITYYANKDKKTKKPNKYIDIEAKAKDIFDRIKIMFKKADAFVVFPGGTGTLLELAAVLECMNKGLMRFKPLVVIGTYWQKVISTLEKEILLNRNIAEKHNITSCNELVFFALNPKNAVDVIKEKIGR